MAQQDVLKFWEKVNEDQELARKLETSVKPGAGWDAVVGFANANGFKFTTQDYADTVKSLPKALGTDGYKAWKKGEKLELGDEELEKVAGGLGQYTFAGFADSRVFSFSSPLRSILQPYGRTGPSGVFITMG